MKERPLLMNGAMVRATLDGSKSQTRRLMKPQPEAYPGGDGGHRWPSNLAQSMMSVEQFQQHPGIFDDMCPHGYPGQHLWVRETWRGVVSINPPGVAPEYGVARYVPDQEQCRRVEYAATEDHGNEPWRPSIHMPRWASRITLEVTGIRIERLHDISTADIIAEGLSTTLLGHDAECDLRDQWRALWESTGGDWDANPWLWAISFKRVTP